MNDSETGQLLAELSNDIDPETFIDNVKQTQLPPAVNDFSERYINEDIGDRNVFIWKWLYNVFKYYELDVVPDDISEETRTIKTLLAMYITIIDDVAEENHDRATFEQIRTIPTSVTTQSSPSTVVSPTVSIESDIWETMMKKLSQTPMYDEFEHLFIYDIHQAMNSAYYSMITNETIHNNNLNVMTQTGLSNYDSHNMCFFSLLDVDLMIATELDTADIALVREVHWDAQQMARIGNWVSTWKREIHEEDFSSGVVARALHKNITSIEQLRNDPIAAIDVIEDSTIESDFIERWKYLKTRIQSVDDTANSVDLRHLADRMETIMSFHLASEGYK